MRSFRKNADERTQIFLNLAGSIESQLRDAYAKRYEDGHETQASLARKLNVSRSTINRRLHGRSNMTEKTIADLVWALGCCIDVNIYDPADRPDINNSLAPKILPDGEVTAKTNMATDIILVVSNVELANEKSK